LIATMRRQMSRRGRARLTRTSMITRDDCLIYASETDAMAAAEAQPELRRGLEQLARTWRDLAEMMIGLPPLDDLSGAGGG
ncbi:MAG TPA: hypothetical protein VHW71_14345, partial [Steroidobacteraceae bacterium]|nr:hypothetical protein [Steroidobacteraceae bacterium]